LKVSELLQEWDVKSNIENRKKKSDLRGKTSLRIQQNAAEVRILHSKRNDALIMTSIWKMSECMTWIEKFGMKGGLTSMVKLRMKKDKSLMMAGLMMMRTKMCTISVMEGLKIEMRRTMTVDLRTKMGKTSVLEGMSIRYYVPF